MSQASSIPLFGKHSEPALGKSKPSYPVYRLQQEQCDKYGVELPFSMQQIELDNFMANVDINTVQLKITKLVRIGTTDYKSKQTKLMVYGYFDLIGTESATGIELVVNDMVMWRDFAISPQHIKRGPNNEEIVQPNPKWVEVYTQAFSKDAVEKAIAEATRTDIDNIQFLVKEGGKTLGFYSYEEFLNLSQEELILRSRLSRTNFPIDTKFTELSGHERLALERESNK